MSTTERTRVADPSATPTVELSYRYDDAADPQELTVFAPGSERLSTEWLTVPADAAVDLAEMR